MPKAKKKPTRKYANGGKVNRMVKDFPTSVKVVDRKTGKEDKAKSKEQNIANNAFDVEQDFTAASTSLQTLKDRLSAMNRQVSKPSKQFAARKAALKRMISEKEQSAKKKGKK